MKPYPSTLFFIFLCFVFSCSNPYMDIQKEMNVIYTSEKITEPGSIVLVKKGKDIIFLKTEGVADVNSLEKIDEHTIFNIGSISKTFVAYGILILAEKGKLSLDDSINKYFEFDNPKIVKDVKIKHLLSHSSGMPDNRKVYENLEFFITAKDVENFSPQLEIDALNFEPGETFQYSNPSFNGLALIIEKVSGMKWQRFIEENIFKPSGMKESKITDGSYPDQGVAHAYSWNNEGELYEDDYGEFSTFAASGNGGVWCSAMDLVKYEKAIQNNVFLGEEYIELSRTVFPLENLVQDSIPPFVGYSWFIRDEDSGYRNVGEKMIYHTGSQGGFRAYYTYLPEKDILLIGLSNYDSELLWINYDKTLMLLKEHNWLGSERE